MTTSLLGAFDWEHLPILLIVGFALFAGGLGARLFQRLRIPQVVGYIVIGVILGRSGLKFIGEDAIFNLRLFNFFALGVIGFMIGGELRLDVLRRHGRQLITILLSEGITAFLFVSLLVFGLGWAMTGQLIPSLALGLVLGSIASSTAPAATVNVLWEYKTRGPLTTTVFAIVALDDGLALVLYGIASSVARGLIGQAQTGLAVTVGRTAYELVGAVVLGVAAAWLLNLVLRVARDHDKALTFILGTLAVVIGMAMAAKVDIILAAMALGMALVNLVPHRSRESFQIVERFAPPIYVLFFVIVGARLSVGHMHGWMWMLGGVYVIGRTGGKLLGAFLGARWAKAGQVVRRYLGLCLFSQGGVAIGLAILASDSFPPEIGNAVIMIVTATTFLVELIGPPCVKVAVDKAGEVGLNVTREDLIKSYTVADVMNRQATCFAEGDTFAKITRTLGETDAMTFPVVDAEHGLLGIITIQDLKQGLGRAHLADLLVAFDLMQPVIDTATETTPLSEAMTRMYEQNLEYLPVVAADGGTAPKGGVKQPPRMVGLLERRGIDRMLSSEMIRRQKTAADREQSELIRDAIRKRGGGEKGK
ncbi:MAG TPA: CBS domain-containing protein [Phycisphaerae bacterium]|nr:CBS domain-containing protein [Phycisphaerae bacterium]